MKIAGALIVIAAIMLALFFSWGAWFFSSTSDMCKNEILAFHASPDKKWKVVVFERDCGATTGFSTQISILPVSGSLQNEGGNIFAADTNHGAAPAGSGGGPEVKVTWKTADELYVEHQRKARVFSENPNFEDVKIIYGEFD